MNSFVIGGLLGAACIGALVLAMRVFEKLYKENPIAARRLGGFAKMLMRATCCLFAIWSLETSWRQMLPYLIGCLTLAAVYYSAKALTDSW